VVAAREAEPKTPLPPKPVGGATAVGPNPAGPRLEKEERPGPGEATINGGTPPKEFNTERKPLNTEPRPQNTETRPINPEEKPLNTEAKPRTPEEKRVNTEEKLPPPGPRPQLVTPTKPTPPPPHTAATPPLHPAAPAPHPKPAPDDKKHPPG
jgi:hypothetical protein